MTPRLAAMRQLIVVDGPGHGRSDPLRRLGTVDECAAVAVEILNALGIVGRVDWLGNAWGGHVGLAVALQAPERLRSLVAISAPPAAIDGDLKKKIRLLAPLMKIVGFRGPVLEGVLASQLADASRESPAVMDRMREMLDRARPSSVARAVRSFILDRTDVRSKLSQIRAPTLYVATDDRGEFGPEQARDAVSRTPDARHAVVVGARTLAPLEQPDQLVDAVLAFWRDTVGESQ